ncbi:hypothetical protein ACFW7J_06195 [Streptomyces sp. NPDC059525]|uniref:hypothetical protein n=1 Tax=Streptomyces sp. NPDC059525 TaxID=3346857 RepID=UPI0036BE3AE7
MLVRGSRFYTLTDASRPPALVISYATVDCAGLTKSLQAIGAAYRQLAGMP